jgi:hypothetical protein
MKNWKFYALSLLAGLSAYHPAHALDCLNEDRYVTCTYSHYDMGDDRRAAELADFKSRIMQRLQTLKIPNTVDDATDKILLQDNGQFDELVDEINRRVNDYMTDHKSEANYRVSGYFVTLGINLSMTIPTGGLIPVGVGGSVNAMLTFAYIPKTTMRLDKETSQWTSYNDSDFDVGGMLEIGAGLGAAGGAAARYGAGVILGDTPHASDIVGAGIAEGATADFSIPLLANKLGMVSKALNIFNYLPNGITVFTMKNKETKGRNVMFYLTRDILGKDAPLEAHATLFLLMNDEEFKRITPFGKIAGGVTIPIPNPSHLPIPNPSRAADCASGRSTENCDDDGNPLPNGNNPVNGGPVIDFPHPVVPLIQPNQPNQPQQPSQFIPD